MPEVGKWAEVVRHPDVMSGDPCIRGTRVTVDTILANIAAGETPAAIQAAFPTLPPGSVEAALSWMEWQLSLPDGWRPARRQLSEAQLADLHRQYDAAAAFDAAQTPEYKLAWAKALWSAWINVFGDDMDGFRRSYPEDAAVLDAAEKGSE